MTRKKDKWRASPAVVRAFKKSVAEEPSSMRLSIGGKPRTWEWILGQMTKGTKLGRKYYSELAKSLKDGGS
jgi:hypothetical protein